MIKQTGFRLTEEDLKILDRKCSVIGVTRTEFFKILIRTGEITSSYQRGVSSTEGVMVKGSKPITRSYEKIGKVDLSFLDEADKKRDVKLILESGGGKFQMVRELMNLDLKNTQKFATEYAEKNDIPEENISITEVQYQDAIIDGFKHLIGWK